VLAENFWRGITWIVLDEIGEALAVAVNQTTHDAEAGALDVFVFAPPRLRPVRDDAFNIPLVRVEKESHQ
jgi:hypothetical protein